MTAATPSTTTSTSSTPREQSPHSDPDSSSHSGAQTRQKSRRRWSTQHPSTHSKSHSPGCKRSSRYVVTWVLPTYHYVSSITRERNEHFEDGSDEATFSRPFFMSVKKVVHELFLKRDQMITYFKTKSNFKMS